MLEKKKTYHYNDSSNENKTIIITEKQIQLLKHHILKEGISSIIYHFTSLPALYQILMSQKFYLKTGVFKDSYEHKLSDGKRMYYLSTTRIKNANEGYSNAYTSEGSVRITLDGEKLSHKYKGTPTNYWGDDSALGRMKYLNPDKVGQPLRWDKDMQQHRNDETEDRIWSFHPIIPNVMEYIRRIDILLPNENVISDYETRIEKARREGKDALVKSFQDSIENRKEEERHLKALIYDIYNLVGRRGILFLYNNENDFSMGNNNIVSPEWLEKNDFYTDYKERTTTNSVISNYSTYNALFNMLSSALAIMVYNEKRENRKKRIIEYCKQYGFQNMINKSLLDKVDSILYRNSNIFDISRDINDNMRANKEDSSKVQDMVTHWMRKNGYRNLRNVVGESKKNKNIRKVRQGMIAYEEHKPDYEIGFEEGDISPYAHVIKESPDYIERPGITYESEISHPFVIFKGFENEPIVGLVGGETHSDIMSMLYDDVFYNDNNECYFDISNGLRDAIQSKEVRPLLTDSYYMQGRYFEESHQIKLGGNIISFYDYTIEGIKRNYSIIINLLNKIKEQGIPVNINTVDFDHWREDIVMRFPLKWIGNGMIDTILPSIYRIEKQFNRETPLYTIYAKNGKVIMVDVDFNIVFSESSYINEEINPEDVDLSSFEIKDELNPKFWKNNKLDSRIRLKLLDIADDFFDSLEINWTEPDDITMTGSLANYTWDENYSDIDLHIIIDYNKVDTKKDFVKNYFDSKKKEWNEKHKELKIFNFPVEVYVQDKNETHKSSGVYSLEQNEWIRKPDKKNFSKNDYNENDVKNIVSDYMNQIDDIETKFNKVEDGHQAEQIYDEAEEVFDSIKDERKNAFKKTSKELSTGNVVFKTLRRNGYIEKISKIKDKSYDKINSLN